MNFSRMDMDEKNDLVRIWIFHNFIDTYNGVEQKRCPIKK